MSLECGDTRKFVQLFNTQTHDHWQGRPRIHDQPPLVCVPIIIKYHRYRYAEEFIDLSEVYTLGRPLVVRSSVFFSRYKRYEWTRVYVYGYSSICMCLQLNFKFVDWITHPFRDLLNSYLILRESPLADTVCIIASQNLCSVQLGCNIGAYRFLFICAFKSFVWLH